MPSKRVERQIDDALLAVAAGAGFAYGRRRIRRLLAKAELVVGIGIAIGTLGLAGVAAAWLRGRSRAANVGSGAVR